MRDRNRRRGSALLAALVFVTMIAGLGVALLQVHLRTGASRVSIAGDQRAFYAAEAGIAEAWLALSLGTVDPDVGEIVALGTAEAPRTIGASEYWTTVARLDARRVSIAATGRDGVSLRSQEVVVSDAADGFFQYAAFGGTGVRLDSNAFLDSYDSMLGDYASQVVAGENHARQNTVVGSNEDIRLRSNTQVHGDCLPGPGHSVDDRAPGTLVTGTTDPAEELVDLPPIEFPVVASSGSRTVDIDVVIGPGDVRLDDVLVQNGARVTIVGPANIVFGSLLMRSGTALHFEPSDGPIKVFAERDFVLESNSAVVTNSDSAVDVQLFLNGDTSTGPNHSDVVLSSNSAFVGAVYAPNASISLNSNFEIFGSVMARELDLSSNGIIHYDEALLYDGESGVRNLVRLAWRRRPARGAPQSSFESELIPAAP